MSNPIRWASGALGIAAFTSVFALWSFGQVTRPNTQAERPKVSVGSQGQLPQHAAFTADQVTKGKGLFQQNCAFCHGKDAGGGESGPDLTRSKLVASDKNGEQIASVLHNGRAEKGMPRFTLPDSDVMDLVAFIHSQQDASMSQTGTRKGVDEADLQTGNVEAGRRFFEGAGGCAGCHSPEKDLKGIATKYTGLRLEQQMLMPRDPHANVTVTTTKGTTLNGVLVYQDEFTLAMTDGSGQYHSFPVQSVKFKVNNPAEAHVDLLGKYTDDDIHNLMAYIQTLK